MSSGGGGFVRRCQVGEGSGVVEGRGGEAQGTEDMGEVVGRESQLVGDGKVGKEGST